MSTATTHIETEKQIVPALRFKEFEGGIVQRLFEHIFLFTTGKNIKQAEASPEFETPCVRYGELYHMYGEVIKEVINKTNLDTSELLFSKGDEILLPSAGEDPLDIGSASALTLENVAIGRTINILRPQEENSYSQIFASYYINEKLRKKISTLARGASISNVYNSDLKKLKINLPALPEQQKIASFLSAVEENIQQLTKKKALLEDYKKGVMQQLYSDQMRFKDENGKAYPDWEEKRLGEIAEIVGGGTPETVKPEYWDGEIQWFTPTEIRSKYISNSKRTITQSGLSKSSAKLLPAGTILFTSRATIAELGFATQECSTNQGFQSLIVNQNNNSEFIYQLIKVNKNEFVKKSQGSTFLEISSKEMKKVKFNIPILEEQQKIATYLSGIDTKIEAVNNQITQTQTFKKGLLQGMFV
jgi:type I restriction enzyme S subunit